MKERARGVKDVERTNINNNKSPRNKASIKTRKRYTYTRLLYKYKYSRPTLEYMKVLLKRYGIAI